MNNLQTQILLKTGETYEIKVKPNAKVRSIQPAKTPDILCVISVPELAVNNKANEAVYKLIKKELKATVEIVGGATATTKLIKVLKGNEAIMAEQGTLFGSL